jgi:predicted transcriptional regulator
VKHYVDTSEDFNAKVLYLNEEIFEYQQAEIISTNTKLQPYDVQCSKLLNKIQSIRKLKQELEKEQKELAQQSNPSLQPKIKLRINGATNILVNAFKQMMNKKGTNGKPYLHYNIKEVAEFICDSFVDEFGEPLSKATVQTYLSPNRIDKDPNNDDKIKL